MRYRPEEIETAREMAGKGATIHQISVALDRPIGGIWFMLRRHKIETKRRRDRLTAEQRQEIVTRYLAGEPVDALAAEFEIDRSYPAILLKRHAHAQHGKDQE